MIYCVSVPKISPIYVSGLPKSEITGLMPIWPAVVGTMAKISFSLKVGVGRITFGRGVITEAFKSKIEIAQLLEQRF